MSTPEDASTAAATAAAPEDELLTTLVGGGGGGSKPHRAANLGDGVGVMSAESILELEKELRESAIQQASHHAPPPARSDGEDYSPYAYDDGEDVSFKLCELEDAINEANSTQTTTLEELREGLQNVNDRLDTLAAAVESIGSQQKHIVALLAALQDK